MEGSRRRVLAAVFSSCLGVGLIFGFEPPLIALVLSRAGASSFAIGAVTGASLVAVIVLGPFYPAAISRFGLRPCVVAGVCVGAAILVVMPVWTNAGFWLCLRFVTGCGLGLAWIASEVWMNSISGRADRGTVMGIYGTVFSAGVMAGPALLEWTGTSGWRPFAVGAACLLLTLAPLVRVSQVDARQAFLPMRALKGTKGMSMVMLAALVAGLIESADLTLLPLFAVHSGLGDRKALLLVTVLMAGNVALQAPIGMLADRVGRRSMLGVCALLGVVGPLLLQSWLAKPGLLWPLVFVWGGTLYAFYGQAVAVLGEECDAAELATANTLFVMVYCVGGVVGPTAGGLFMDAWPDFGLQGFLSVAALTLLAAIGANSRRRRAALPTMD